MASSSSSHQQNQRFNYFSEIEPASKRRRVSESSRVYDVFINHRGPDVKATLATQLYNSLQQWGIEAFLDSEEKELGNSFPSIIETAIHSAKVHIAIFSIGYAESPWCLNELVLMLESTAKIIPIFYRVKPSDLRHVEKGVYAKAFIKYEEKGRYLEKLNSWKEALRSLSFTAGEEFNSDGDCQKIVAEVQKEVQRKKPLHVAEYPVGLNNLVEDFEKRCLDELVQDFESQCRQEGKHKGQVVGIFGMGGVGKTTLAKELFNRKGLYYERSSFLIDVREKCATSQLPSLQSKLVKDLFGKSITFTCTEEGTADLKDRLQRSPLLSVLIVVDDIDHVQQLAALAVIDILKASYNTLVIVTTRDAGVLITSDIHVGYNLKGMDRNHAKELFCWHAFGKAHPCSEYEELVEDFVDVCGGLPLSVQVLGRHVHGRHHWYWSSELIKIRKILPRDVKQRLIISFEALDNEEKQVFMDAACFFVGKPKIIAERVWEASGWNAQHALETLKDKCLIVEDTVNLSLNVEGEIVLRMHDHLRDLGREMAFELKPPQRLWRPQDLKSLESGGFNNILTKTNVRCFSSIFDESMGSKVTFFLGQSDSWLETSASLLWLQLEGNSEEQPCIPSWIPLQNLHCLKIRLGQLQTLWENRIQAPSQLRELKISETSLKEFPDFVGISDNLENVFLDARQLPIQGLSLLESLNMKFSHLRLKFSTLIGEQASSKSGEKSLKVSLIILNFKFSRELHWTSREGPMSGIQKLEINGEESVYKIWISGIHYPSLVCIKLHFMKNLVEVGLARVKTLNFLDIKCCPKLKRLAATSDLPNLGSLTLVSEIPDFRNLAGAKVKDCTDLLAVNHFNSVSEISRSMAQLKISECQELEELRLGHLSCLEKITIQNCNHLKSVSEISDLAKLVELEISDCEKLEFEYLCFRGMKCLESITFQRSGVVKYFDLNDCPNLKTMQFSSKELVQLSVYDCPELTKLPAFEGLNFLKSIVINRCWKLEFLRLYYCQNLMTVTGNCSVRRLYISSCPDLELLPDLSGMSSLETIEISLCEKIKNIRLPITLTSLSLQSCRALPTVTGTADLSELRDLAIRECPELEELPDLSRMSSLETIEISQCEKIKNIRLPTTLTSLSLQSCRALRTVEGTGDLFELGDLAVTECPELELLPDLSRMSSLEAIEISQCEKIKNIRLPTTLIILSIKSCRALRTVAGIGDLFQLGDLAVKECPELELLPDLSRSRLSRIVTDSCEKLQNIEGIEELQALKCMQLVHCSNALIRNSVHKLKSLRGTMLMIGRAVDEAESTLNANLFHDANVDVDAVREIGPHETYPMRSELEIVFVCFVVAVDSCSSAESINGSLQTINYFNFCGVKLKVREGEWVVTLVWRNDCEFYIIKEILDVLRSHGILKKGIWAGLKKDQMGKSVQILSTIVDRLYHL